MRRYLEIICGCLLAGIGALIAAVTEWTVNALFGSTMVAVRFSRFEVSVNNVWIVAVPVLVFAVALMLVGGSMALESHERDG